LKMLIAEIKKDRHKQKNYYPSKTDFESHSLLHKFD